MASEDVGALVARVVADTESFRTEMTRVSRQLESNTARMNRALAKVNTGVGSISKGLQFAGRVAAAFGIAFSINSIVGFTRRVFEAGDQLFALSQRLNVTVESLSELQYVAKLSDVEFDALRTSLEFMVKTLGEAQRGTRESIDAFRQLGIDFRAIANLPVDQQLETVAEALSRVEDETQRVALAQRVFSRGGTQMLQITKDGAAGIRALRQEARDLGAVMQTEQARAIAEASDQIDRMKAASSQLATVLVAELAPSLERAALFWRQFIQGPDQTAFDATRNALSEQVNRQIAEVERLERLLSTQQNWQDNANPVARLIFGDQSGNIAETTRQLAAAREELERLREAWFNAQSPTQAPQGGTNVPGLISGGGEQQLPPWAGMDFKRLPGTDIIDANEEFRKNEEELTEIIRQQHDERVMAAIEAAEKEKFAVLESQQAQIDFRAAVAQQSAALILGVFGQSKAVQLAAIAFEKLMAVRRVKLANLQAAELAFASQLVPGDPTSLARAAAARAKVLAQGRIAVAQAIALSVISGVAEASQVLNSSGSLGSFTNPISAAPGSSTAAGGSVAASHRRPVIEVHFHGDQYGWDRYIQERVVNGLREAIDGKEVIIFGRGSRQAQILTAGT